jgi:hypothetical protein
MHSETHATASGGSQPPTATPNRAAFPHIHPLTDSSLARPKHISATSLPTPTSPASSSHAIPPPEPDTNRAASPPMSVLAKPSSQITPTPSTIRDANISLPSPAASSVGQQPTSRQSSIASIGHSPNVLRPPSPEKSAQRKWGTHPSEWTVEEVVDWLRSKGFGDDVCDRFIGM